MIFDALGQRTLDETPQQIEDYLRTRMTEGAWVDVPLEVRQDLGKWLIMLASNIVWK